MPQLLEVTANTTAITIEATDVQLQALASQIVVEIHENGITTAFSAEPIELTVEATVSAPVVSSAEVQIVTVSEPGPPGADAVGQRAFPFSCGDATPATLMTVNAGQMILAVTISLDVPFNGVGASLSVGDAGDDGRLLDSNMIEPTIVGAFQNAPCLRFVSDTQILLTIVPGTGASSGSGVVSLYLE